MKFTGRGIIQNPGGNDIGYGDEIPQKLQETLGKKRIGKMKKSGEIDGRENVQAMTEKARENQKKSNGRESLRHKSSDKKTEPEDDPELDEDPEKKEGFLNKIGIGGN